MKILKKHWLFLLIVSAVLILLQYTPYLYHRWQTPPDRVYLGAERYTPDYYVYLFYTNQGAMGRTSVLDYYTNEPHDGSLVHIEYLMAGKIGSVFGLSLPATFYLFRTLTLLLYVLVSFWFIGLFFKNTLLHKLTFLLSVFWGGIFWPQFSSSILNPTSYVLNLKSYFDFYQPPDLINRLGFEPHKFLGMSLFLIILSVIARSVTTKQSKEIATPLVSLGSRNDQEGKIIAVLVLLSFLAGFIHGVTAISLIFTIVFYLLFMFIVNVLNKKSIRHFFSLLIPLFPIILLLSLPLLYWQLVFTNNPVWQAVSLWERHFAQADSSAPLLSTITGYVIVLGPLIVLSGIGLRKFLGEHKKLGLLLLSFLLSNLFLFFVGYIFLGTTKHRYYQTPYLVGWSVLAMYGITRFTERFAGRLDRFSRSRSRACRGTLTPQKIGQATTANLAILTIFTLFILLSLPNFKQGLDTQLYQFGTPPNLDVWGYPPISWYQGLLWMQKNTPSNAVILSLPIAGQIIPALPGRRVVVGDYVHSYHYFDKLPQVTSFFKGELSIDQARSYLKQESVNYVFAGFEEKAQGNLNKYSAFLTPVFNSDGVTIFSLTTSL